jgi:hypothetical protein
MNFKFAQAGAVYPAVITRCEVCTAADVFTSREGSFNGGNGTNPEDPVLNIFGKIDGQSKERKLGTLRLPRDGSFISDKSNLYKLLKSAGIDLNRDCELSDDFRELVGKNAQITITTRGFPKLVLN